MYKKAYLVLQNGIVFKGSSLGSEGEVIGEVCFNTGMTGYQEILTDPSYCGQLITMTYPHIGNYGINLEDIESHKIQASGFIIREETIVPSNFRSTESLGKYLQKQKIVGIQNIDTRMLVRILREEGAMNGIISTKDLNIKSLLNKVNNSPSMSGLDLVKKVTCSKKYIWKTKKVNQSKNKYNIAVIDFGIKQNILRLLDSYGFTITVFPAQTCSDEILHSDPDGIFLSNGPGDPSAVNYGIITVKNLLLRSNKPIFGICLGHQILALALGGKTYKLKFGHRGCNHPVKNLKTKKIEITSQNHGFAVSKHLLPKNIEITHASLNDDTIEGFSCDELSAFSVQYHPESSPGPHDSQYLFEKFFNMITINKVNAKT